MTADLSSRLFELPFRICPGHKIKAPRLPVSVIWPTVYPWASAEEIVSTLKEALARQARLCERDTRQPYPGVFMLGVESDKFRGTVVLDYSDYHHYLCEEALGVSYLYIKLQYRRGGYGDPRIVPGGYPVTAREYYRYYLPFRRYGNRRRKWGIVGRFGLRFQHEVRTRAVAILKGIPGFAGEGKVRYSRFLAEAANSKLALHMPGNGPFTHRVPEFLGIGTCVLSERFGCELPVPLEPGVHYVEIAPDLSDLREKALWYLSHDADRNAIADAGRAYFDKHLHADRLATYYLSMVLALAEAGASSPSQTGGV